MISNKHKLFCGGGGETRSPNSKTGNKPPKPIKPKDKQK